MNHLITDLDLGYSNSEYYMDLKSEFTLDLQGELSENLEISGSTVLQAL